MSSAYIHYSCMLLKSIQAKDNWNLQGPLATFHGLVLEPITIEKFHLD